MKNRPVVYIAITNHGFGHAVRAASVAAEIQRLNPDILLILVTTAPRWLLESYITGDFILRERALDVGVIQADSLKMDKVATLEKLQEIRKRQYAIASGEVNFIHLNRVGLILADIPPLAATIGKAAGIPVWMMSNFGWDFIYRPWGGEFEAIADWIADCFSQCDCLFRLPFHEPMSAFPTIKNFGLTGGTPRYQPETIRRDWGLKSPLEQTILLTFGGLGLEQIPYHNLQDFPDWQFITFDRHAPDLPNLVKIDNQTNGDRLRPVDFMPVCGRVVSKPGFSTFSEACRQNVPIISLTREGFAESPLLLSGIQQHSHHRIVTQEEFFEGNWEFLRESPIPPQSTEPLLKNGTEAIAQAVVDYFQTESASER